MIELVEALKGMQSAQDRLRTASAIINPVTISEQMMRLTQYVGIIDEHLAGYEKEYEITLSAKIQTHMTEGMKITPAKTLSEMELAETKGQILYLTRLSGSAWRQITVAQSRINHLRTESTSNI